MTVSQSLSRMAAAWSFACILHPEWATLRPQLGDTVTRAVHWEAALVVRKPNEARTTDIVPLKALWILEGIQSPCMRQCRYLQQGSFAIGAGCAHFRHFAMHRAK